LIPSTFPRTLERAIQDDLDLSPAVTLMGARQVGKSWLCRRIASTRGMVYRTLDDADSRRHAIADPEGFLSDVGGTPAVIDEIQRAPDILLAVKAAIDRDRRPGRFLLTGSNQPVMRQGTGDSLLGRTAYRTLRPLLQSELRLDEAHGGWSDLFQGDERTIIATLERRAEANGPVDWRQAVSMGGFPDAVTISPADRIRRLDHYAEAFTNRDVRELIAVESSGDFEQFFRSVAASTGQILNLSDLARDVQISPKTATRWMDALARSYMIDRLPPYSLNSRQRIVKAPRLVFVDSAFAMVVARETEPRGCHLETMIVQDALAWRDEAPGRTCHHWRSAKGQEVDLVLEDWRKLVAVEIKASTSVNAADARHLVAFREMYPATTIGLVLSSAPTVRQLARGIIAAPWWAAL
jgi:predicted AAA+ superfamily ATPase